MNWKHLIMLGIAVLMAMPANAQVQQAQTRNARRVGTTMKATESEKERMVKAIDAARKENGQPVTVFTPLNQTSSSAAENDKARRKAINDFLTQTMRKKENPANLVREIKGKELPKYVIEGGDLYVLKEIPHNNINTQDNEFFLEDNHDIFPGLLLVADKNLANGNPTIITDLGIGKVDVSLSFDTGGNRSKKNVDVTYDGIYTAVQELLREAYKNGFVAPSLTTAITDDYTSKEQIAIKAGCDVNYAAKFSASVSTDESHTTITHIDDLSQIFYTVIVTPADGDYSNLFSPETTVKDLERVFKEYGEFPFVFVSQMSYGRRLYKFSDYKASDFKMDASAKASYSGVSFTSTANVIRNSTASNTKVYLMGGDPSLASGLIQDGATVSKVLAKYEKADGSNEAMIASQKNQGISMSYATKYLGSKQNCKRSTTGSYNTAEYRKCVNSLKFKVHAKVDHRGEPAGSRVKPKFYYRTIKVRNGSLVQEGITHDPIEPTMKCYETWQKTIELPEGEYIDGNIEVSVRTRYCGDWSQSMSSNYIDPVLYDGSISTLTFAGTVGKDVYISESSDIELIGIKKGKK